MEYYLQRFYKWINLWVNDWSCISHKTTSQMSSLNKVSTCYWLRKPCHMRLLLQFEHDFLVYPSFFFWVFTCLSFSMLTNKAQSPYFHYTTNIVQVLNYVISVIEYSVFLSLYFKMFSDLSFSLDPVIFRSD